MSIERDTLLGRSGLCDSQRYTQDGIGSQICLVLGAIHLDEEVIDLGLVLAVNPFLDQGRADDIVDVLHSLQDTLARPVGFVSIA